MKDNFKEQLAGQDRLDLDTAWTQQTTRFISLGFNKEFNLSPQDYVDSLPKFSPKPPGLESRFDTPLLIEPRIPLERLLEMCGIKLLIANEESGIRDLPGSGFTIPDKPYVVWVGIKDSDAKKSIVEMRKNLRTDERGATVLEVIHFYLNNPKILDENPNFVVKQTHLVMLGSQELDPVHNQELSLYLGTYIGGNVFVTDNGDPATAPNVLSRPLVVQRG